jgi:predicted nucleic acid-binding protein
VSGRLVLSAQVLNEFYWASTRPHRTNPLDHATACRVVQSFASHAKVVALDSRATLVALEAVERHSLSFWDALIWAAAKLEGCDIIYSEDFQNGRVLDGVRFENPLM